jgi:hypothetical protein
MEEGEIVDNGGMVNSSIIYLMYCKNFYNATMYPTQDNNKEKKKKTSGAMCRPRAQNISEVLMKSSPGTISVSSHFLSEGREVQI